MLKVSQLFIYPIKSLSGISVGSATVAQKGFENDRRFMLVDRDNRFLTIREFPKMTRLQPVLTKEGMYVHSLDTDVDPVFVDFSKPNGPMEEVVIWRSKVKVQTLSPETDAWFSEALGARVKLVFMPEKSRRPVSPSSIAAPKNKFVSFADGYPFMMLGKASLDDLNRRFPNNRYFTVHRFRPNIVFSGGFAYQEDAMGDFTIQGIRFTAYERCARCSVPNVDPESGQADGASEPLATLSSYRRQGGNIYFGVNLIHQGRGTIQLGDELILNFNKATS